MTIKCYVLHNIEAKRTVYSIDGWVDRRTVERMDSWTDREMDG